QAIGNESCAEVVTVGPVCLGDSASPGTNLICAHLEGCLGHFQTLPLPRAVNRYLVLPSIVQSGIVVRGSRSSRGRKYPSHLVLMQPIFNGCRSHSRKLAR